MLNVSNEIKALYEQSDVSKEYFIEFIGFAKTYSNNEIKDNGFELVESLCSDDNLNFSKVEKSSLKFKVIDYTQVDKELKNKKFKLYQTLNGNELYKVPLGTYIIDEVKREQDNILSIVAYCQLSLFEKDVSDWWNNLTFPISTKNLTISLFNYVGAIATLPTTYTNSDFMINKNIDVEDTAGTEFLSYLQELSGLYYKPNRNGDIVQVNLNSSNVLAKDYGKELLFSTSISEYTVKKIDKLVVRGTQTDIGVIVGTGENAYIIQSNPLMYGYNDVEIRPTVENIFDNIKNIEYIPFSAKAIGLPYIECGDLVQIKTKKDNIAKAFILYRKMGLRKSIRDEFQIKGEETRKEVKTVNRVIKELNKKTLEIIANVEKLETTMTDLNAGLQSQITQQAGSINIQAQQFKYKNLLMNSDFSMNSISETGIPSFNSWESTVFQTYPNAISIVNDNDFPNGKALRINKTVTPTFQLGQTINFQPKQVKTDTLYITFDIKILSWSVSYPSIFPYITYEDGSTTAFAHTIVPGDNKYHRYMMKITGDHIDKTKYIKSINFYIYCWENSILDLLINRIFVTTDTPVPNKEVWNDFAGKDVISQINVSPTTIKIKAQYLDITGFVTFNDLSTSGSTIINGDNIKTGKISAMTIDASYLTNLKSINGVSINATFDLTLPNWDGGLIKVFYNNGIATGWNYTAGTANYVTVRNGANTGSIQLIFKNGLFMGTS